jgi:hypothetical protein
MLFDYGGIILNLDRGMFENKVLTKIFGPKKEERIEGWRKLHEEELHNLYSSTHIIRMIRSRWMIWAGDVARMGKKGNAYRVLVGKSEGREQLGRPRRRCEDNIKMDLREIGWSGVDWIHLTQDCDQWRTL